LRLKRESELQALSCVLTICLPPQGTPPPPTHTQQPMWPTAHTAHSQHCDCGPILGLQAYFGTVGSFWDWANGPIRPISGLRVYFGITSRWAYFGSAGLFWDVGSILGRRFCFGTSGLFGIRVCLGFGSMTERDTGGGGRVSLYTILPLPMLYGVWHTTGGVRGASYIAQQTCNGIIAIVWAMPVGGADTRMNDSCTKASKVKQHLVKAEGGASQCLSGADARVGGMPRGVGVASASRLMVVSRRRGIRSSLLRYCPRDSVFVGCRSSSTSNFCISRPR